MKQSLKFAIYLAVIVFCSTANAQNLPDSSTFPAVTGSGPGAENRPDNYINMSGTVYPTLFNYSRRYTPLIPVKSLPGFDATKNMSVHVSTCYKDGFGLPLMTIERNGSSRDIIQPFDLRHTDVELDYLPYPDSAHRRFKMKPFENQASYYLNKFPDEKETAYSKTKLQKVDGILYTKRYAPGLQNVGEERGSSASKHTNSSTELPILEFNGTTVCTTGVDWQPHSLIIAREENMHGQESISYSDKNKKLICKKVKDNNSSIGNSDGYLYTYYIYDDLGKLTHIVPPLAYLELQSNGCLSNPDELCFSYVYDEYGNIIEKHTPARDAPDELIYDVNYKAVMSRSANMADRNQWSFSIYDKQGRIVITGIYTGHMSTDYWRDVVLGKTAPILRGVPQQQTLEYWLKNYFTGTVYPLNIDSCVIHTYNYYDNYDNVPFGTPTTFDNSFSASYLNDTGTVTPEPYYFVHGKLVASKTRILDNGIAHNFTNTPWITSVYFYDEKGRGIQTQTLNPWNTTNWDITTVQFNFSGAPILDINKLHLWPGSKKPTTTIMNKYTFGGLTGRLETVQQKIDTGAWQPISGYIYDEMGAVKVKWLGNVEEQVYSYDIRGKSTGINVDSIMETSVTSNTKSFYSQLHYDHGYSDKRYDGSISGFMWRVRGHDVMSYGYEYDDVNRMTAAEFRVYNTDAGSLQWNKNSIDFTVAGIDYDVNGNMQHLNQWGYDPSYNPTDIDVLTYTYDNGNRLIKVEDGGSTSASDIHDFDNGSSADGNDYQYDLNGNLIADANKDITDITYNHLDLPDSVTGANGTVKNIYTASGTLLQKIITENSISDTLRYWGPFIMRNDEVDHILHSEGRARYDTSADAFTYDFFVKDHLGNVRTIVEGSMSYDEIEYHAGWEIISANYEERFFDQIGNIRDVAPTIQIPSGIHTGRLNGTESDKRIGASILIHAMGGDELNLQAYGYYEQVQPGGYTMYTMPSEMFNSLSGVMTSGVMPGGEAGVYEAAVSNLITNTNYDLYDALKQSVTNTAFPRAYLNYLVFDENFDLKPEHSKIVQIQGGANAWHLMQMPTRMIMPVTGYVLAYMSNESPFDVWIDEESLIHYESNLLEESHYYPHGLVIEAGTQSIQPKNEYLHQGKKLQHELGLELYDFHARQYDPQIGRFWGVDPADQFPSGYTGMGNDPANMIDPSGMVAMGSGGLHPGTMRDKFGRNREDWKFFQEEARQFQQTQMALSLSKNMDQPELSAYVEFSSQPKPVESQWEMDMAKMDFLTDVANSLQDLNLEAAQNTAMQTDEIGPKDGIFELPGIGIMVGKLADLASSLMDDVKNGHISIKELQIKLKSSKVGRDGEYEMEDLAWGGNGDKEKAQGALTGATLSGLQQLTKDLASDMPSPVTRKLTDAKNGLGVAGAALTVLSMGSDFQEYRNEQISGARLSYRLTGTGTALLIGTMYGGWVGGTVGLGFTAGELIYDNAPRMYYRIKKEFGNAQYQMNSGRWRPILR